jgi:hypothetical protein
MRFASALYLLEGFNMYLVVSPTFQKKAGLPFKNLRITELTDGTFWDSIKQVQPLSPTFAIDSTIMIFLLRFI